MLGAWDHEWPVVLWFIPWHALVLSKYRVFHSNLPHFNRS
jgi:hypothetical protein